MTRYGLKRGEVTKVIINKHELFMTTCMGKLEFLQNVGWTLSREIVFGRWS
jgi:hypothetical protein